jgi:hypothetical protein
MSPSIDPFYWRVARIALSAAGDHGFALGGGLALIAQGVLDRPTQDVDLFSDWEGSVRGAADLVCQALELNGIVAVVEEGDSDLDEVIDGLGEYMVELTAYRDPADREGVRLSLGQLYRSRSPVILDVGPVLHLDDLRAWKVAALVARAEPRDFVDVGVFLRECSPEELLALARGVDPGIEAEDIVAVAARLNRMPDRELADYGLDAAAIAELRHRFMAWPRAV